MDKEIIQQARQSISPPSESALCERSQVQLPENVMRHLGSSKENFLTKYNPSTADHLLEKHYTPGRLALLPDVPCLSDVANRWGKEIAVSWLEILLTNVEEKLGNNTFLPEAKKDTASLLYSYYRDMNLAEVLLFFAWYKLNKFRDLYTSGLDKISCAFALYREQRDEELERIERKQEYERMELERKRWQENAISYEEYLKTKNENLQM